MKPRIMQCDTEERAHACQKFFIAVADRALPIQQLQYANQSSFAIVYRQTKHIVRVIAESFIHVSAKPRIGIGIGYFKWLTRHGYGTRESVANGQCDFKLLCSVSQK